MGVVLCRAMGESQLMLNKFAWWGLSLIKSAGTMISPICDSKMAATTGSPFKFP